MKNDKIRILITAGGTRVPLDGIRSITNESSGRFGADIANSFVEETYNNRDLKIHMHYVRSKKAEVPYTDLYMNQVDFFDTYESYSELVSGCLAKNSYDIILLSAAVSDFGPIETVKGKMSSSEELCIRLKPLPKIISTVREKAPNAVICGFKCLCEATVTDLIEASKKQIEKYNIDMVIANDWATIKHPDHEIYVVRKHEVTAYYRGMHNLPDCVVKECLNEYRNKRSNA